MIARPDETAVTYRSIFISDFHLGTKTCRAGDLLDFLRSHDAQFIYLVGDIVDGWQLKKNWNWSQLHNDVIQKLLRKVRKGSIIKYIPGNHDAFAASTSACISEAWRLPRPQCTRRQTDGAFLSCTATPSTAW